LPAGGASAKRFGRRSALARGGPKTGAVGLSAQIRLALLLARNAWRCGFLLSVTPPRRAGGRAASLQT